MSSNIGNVVPALPLGYTGYQVPLNYIVRNYAPTPTEWQFTLPTLWIDTSANNCYILVSKANRVAVWQPLAGGIQDIEIPGGAQVYPNASGQLSFTASGGLTITNPSANTIEFSVAPVGISWNDVVSTPTTMAANNGYLVDTAGLCTLILPTTASQFTYISIVGNGAGGWTIQQNAGQQIIVNSSPATVGTGGSVSSTLRYDKIDLLCITANTTWTALNIQGNPTVV